MTGWRAGIGGMVLAVLAAATVCAQTLPRPTDDGRVQLPTPQDTIDGNVDLDRFGDRPVDEAYGAFQRGLYLTALRLALPRAEGGDVAAQMLAAEIHARGLGVPVDIAEASRWYLAAAESGNAEAQLQAALILLGNDAADRDNPNRAEALALLDAAAEQNNAPAAFNLAQLLVDERRDFETLQRVARLYRIAAEGGIADAQFALALFYATGQGGLQRDDVIARDWLKKASDKGMLDAVVEYASWLVEGIGGDRDFDTAFTLMRGAAERGDVQAMARLSRLYRYALGTEPDPVTAAAWYLVAKRNGLVDAELDVFLDGLTDDERRRALEQANAIQTRS